MVMAEGSSQYKSSTERERFERQLERDLSRSTTQQELRGGEGLKAKRLSSSVLKKLISEDTKQWANAILDRKLAANNAGNIATQSTRSTSAETASAQSPQVGDYEPTKSTASSYAYPLQEPPEDNGGGNGGGELPSFNAYICENGEPVLYKIYGELL